MMRYVDINVATPWQLAILLDLTRDQVEALLLQRPFSDVESLRLALPSSHRDAVTGLRVAKKDINLGSDEELVRASGISRQLAYKITQARPFFLQAQLGMLVDGTCLQQIEQMFSVPEFAYVDKPTGQLVSLTADSSEILVSKTESESIERVASRRKLKSVYPGATGSVYEVLSLPETEAATGILFEIQQHYGRNVIPAFRDQAAGRRYFNPKFCVVQFHPSVSERVQREIMTELGLELEERHRSEGLKTLRIMGAQTDPAALTRTVEALNALPQVKFAEPNYLGFDDAEPLAPPKPFTPQSDAESGMRLPWNLLAVRADEAWNLGKGSHDTVISLIDSGVDIQHPSIQAGLLFRGPNENWNFSSDSQLEPYDDDGHGTFIAGILVGNGAQNVRGLCPGCRILPLKVPLNGDVSSYARRHDAILYAIERTAPDQVPIINISWKTTGDVAVIRDAIDAATARGAIIVASAGNFPFRRNQPHYPSDYPAVISVAAVGPNRKRPGYSYYGDKVDISAPGGDPSDDRGAIYSAAPDSMVTTGYGTSFAAPHVAGIAALMASRTPLLTASEIRSALEASAASIGELGMGHGLVDAAAALGSAIGEGSFSTNDALALINCGDPESLVARFGLLPFTARVLVARSPHTSLEAIRGTAGLTDEQYAAIADSQTGSTAPSGTLHMLNSGDLQSIIARFGLLAFTARLLVARRPYANLEAIRGTMGLTDKQYAAMARPP